MVFSPGVDAQHLQFVGVGMAFGGQHAGDAEASQPRRGVFHPLDLEPDGVEPDRDLRHRRVGFEEILEPGERELHAPTPARLPTPADNVGTSSAEKP